MKRHSRWFKLCLAMTSVLALTACSSGQAIEQAAQQRMTPEEYVTAAIEVLQTAESFTGNIQIVSQMDESKADVNATISMVRQPLRTFIEENTSFDGQSSGSQIYLDAQNDGTNAMMYMKYGNQWTELSLTQDAALDNVQIYDIRENMLLLLQNSNNWTMTTEKNHQVTLHGTLPADNIYPAVEGGKLLQFTGMSGIGETYFTNLSDQEVVFTCEENTGTPLSLSVDLTQVQQQVTNQILAELQSEPMQPDFAQYDVSMSIQNINQTQPAKIPAEAYAAINYEQEISHMNEMQASQPSA